jgi:hypothetical protein
MTTTAAAPQGGDLPCGGHTAQHTLVNSSPGSASSTCLGVTLIDLRGERGRVSCVGRWRLAGACACSTASGPFSSTEFGSLGVRFRVVGGAFGVGSEAARWKRSERTADGCKEAAGTHFPNLLRQNQLRFPSGRSTTHSCEPASAEVPLTSTSIPARRVRVGAAAASTSTAARAVDSRRAPYTDANSCES